MVLSIYEDSLQQIHGPDFGGFAAVAKRFSDISWGYLLPAGGGSLRFRLTKSEKVNFSADYGIGRHGHTFSMGIGEAF